MSETVMDNAGKPARLSGRWPVKRERIGPPACPIMDRWMILRFRGRKVLVHHFLPGSEDLSLHDHPSPFWTLVLQGFYDDIQMCTICQGDGRVRSLSPCDDGPRCEHCGGTGEIAGDRMRIGTLRHRHAGHAHRTRTCAEGCWTLVLMGRKTRPWGFWTRGRWWPWADHEKAFGMGMRCPDTKP